MNNSDEVESFTLNGVEELGSTADLRDRFVAIATYTRLVANHRFYILKRGTPTMTIVASLSTDAEVSGSSCFKFIDDTKFLLTAGATENLRPQLNVIRSYCCILGNQLLLYDWAKQDLTRKVRALVLSESGDKTSFTEILVAEMFDSASTLLGLNGKKGEMVQSFMMKGSTATKRFIILYSTENLTPYFLPPPAYAGTNISSIPT